MERLGITLEQAHLVGWRHIVKFARHLPPDSAVWRYRHDPELAKFESDLKQSAILADIYDVLAAFLYAFAVANADKKKPKQPEPYPRPGQKPTRKIIGKGAIALADFNKWYYGGS